MDEQEQARQELEALVKVPGALRVITNEVVPELRQDMKDATSPIREGKEALLLQPDTFVIHHVTRLEAVEHRGTLRAHTDEGDWTEGRPAALLKRLREWRG